MKISPLEKLGLKKKKTQAKRDRQRRIATLKVQTFIVLNVVLVAGLALYTYQNYLQYSLMTRVLAQNNQTITSLNGSFESSQANLKDKRGKFSELRGNILKDLEIIFPPFEAYTELTRQLDQFFFTANSTNPPIMHNNLRFEEGGLSDDGTYYILPFSMMIESSKANFERFLDHVAKSGSIGSQVRLMSIESIQINFIEPSKEQPNEFDVNFTVNMNAYFQKGQQNNQK